MKYYLQLISAVAFAEFANALEHPSLRSEHDYVEKWTDSTRAGDTYRDYMEKNTQYDVIDHGRRPVIGVLTEPLRGELYTPSTSRYKKGD